MAAENSTNTTAAPLAAAQHQAALWADDSLQVYAVMMGSRIPDLGARLALAQAQGEIADHDCLLPGALAPDVQRTAPVLVWLKRDTPFTTWLLFEACATLGEWGVVVRSAARLLPLRNHLRGLLQAQIPSGHRVTLDWMDPQVLQVLLPRFEPAELGGFFGPVQALVVPGQQVWSHAEFELGHFSQRQVPVTQAA